MSHAFLGVGVEHGDVSIGQIAEIQRTLPLHGGVWRARVQA
jgi:hypothetical protein